MYTLAISQTFILRFNTFVLEKWRNKDLVRGARHGKEFRNSSRISARAFNFSPRSRLNGRASRMKSTAINGGNKVLVKLHWSKDSTRSLSRPNMPVAQLLSDDTHRKGRRESATRGAQEFAVATDRYLDPRLRSDRARRSNDRLWSLTPCM